MLNKRINACGFARCRRLLNRSIDTARGADACSGLPAGSLPEAWGSAGALPALTVLAVKNNGLSGGLPASWGNSSTALPSLTILSLDSNALSGALPPSWSSGWRNLS
jgi:hypothetical protein